jgi:broad specificity phosphatase PhoE
VEIIEDKRFMEQTFGEFKGMKHADIVEKYNCKIHSDETRVYRNNKVEPLKKFNARVSDAYREVSEKYKGKNILIVAH